MRNELTGLEDTNVFSEIVFLLPAPAEETGTLSQGRQPLAAPQLAANQAQTHSLTPHLPCLPLKHKVFVMPWDATLGQGHGSGRKA